MTIYETIIKHFGDNGETKIFGFEFNREYTFDQFSNHTYSIALFVEDENDSDIVLQVYNNEDDVIESITIDAKNNSTDDALLMIIKYVQKWSKK
jgi:hypothetical protein